MAGVDMAEIVEILEQHLAGQPLAEAQWQQLVAWELADTRRAWAWQITPATVRAALEERLRWLQQAVLLHDQLGLPPYPLRAYLPLYWQLWLPLALWLKAARARQSRPLVQGFLGGQGTGKTTLTRVLQQLLAMMGYRAVGLSIDDLYKTFSDRKQLRQADPRLIWRGPPGTHDIDLGIETLDNIRQAQPRDTVLLPRFDKSLHGGEGDRTTPEPVQNVDILLFEGWFLGVRPLEPQRFDQALPDPIQTESDRQFARDMNQRLRDYLPLWERLDYLTVLCPQDYRISQQWRRQAEHQMKAQGKAGMSDAAIDQFVEYFWKALHPELFITPLKNLGAGADLVITIGPDRIPLDIFAPLASASSVEPLSA